MKVIKASSYYLEKKHPYEMIERIGKVCYKSEGSITDTSAEPFVEKMVKLNHMAMLEHGWIHFIVQSDIVPYIYDRLKEESKYLVLTMIGDIATDKDLLLISGSLRALNYKECKAIWDLGIGKLLCGEGFETALLPKGIEVPKGKDDIVLKMLTDEMVIDALQGDTKEIMKHIVHSAHFVCDRGVSHEFVRHRPCSFAQESTRYCDYQHDKHGNEITVIEPSYFETTEMGHSLPEYEFWLNAMETAEERYMRMRGVGLPAQIARAVLPNSLKTELIITANEEEWQHIIDLRYRGTTGAPHPDMKQSMSLIVDTLVEKSDGRLIKE